MEASGTLVETMKLSSSQNKKRTKLLAWIVYFAVLGFSGPGNAAATSKGKPEAIVEKIRQRCLHVLELAIENENPFVRSAAIRAAGESEDPAVIPLLKKGSGDSYPTSRLFALQGLKKISFAETRALIEETMIRDADMWVRGAAVEFLGELGGKDSAPAIRNFLEDPDLTVRLAAATALFKLGEKERLSIILKTLKKKNVNYQYQAIGYLGKIGKQVLPHLAELLDAPNNGTVIYSLKAIRENAEPSLFPRLKTLAQRSDPSLRRQALLALEHLPTQASQDILKEACSDVDPMVRLSAAVALNRQGIPACQAVLSDSLKDKDFGVRSSAARALGEISMANKANLLAEALNDPNARVRTAAVRAAGMMGGPDAFPLLMKMLEDPNEAIRAYAAGSLIKLLK